MGQIKYYLGALITVPLLPLLYYQGKKVRSSVPELPEAKGSRGVAGNTSHPPFRLLTIGESTIAGVGVETHQEGFTGTLAHELAGKLQKKVEWRVYARSGYTARRVTHKIIPKIEENEADLIVVGLGGNDAFTLNTPAKWQAQIKELISAIRGRFGNTPIAFTNMPPIKSFPAFTSLIKFTVGSLVELLGDALEELTAQEANIYFNDERITLEAWIERHHVKAPPSAFFSDGVHPSPLTYQTWARDFTDFLLEKVPVISRRDFGT